MAIGDDERSTYEGMSAGTAVIESNCSSPSSSSSYICTMQLKQKFKQLKQLNYKHRLDNKTQYSQLQCPPK